MELEQKINEIMNDRKFINEMNDMMLNGSIDLLVSDAPTFDLKPTVFKGDESKWGESPLSNGGERYIKYSQRGKMRKPHGNYRVYNDNSRRFISPVISKISVLNDPLDTIGLHKHI